MVDESIFLLAAQRGELGKFIAGCDPYFVSVKNAEDIPQNVDAAFNMVVYKLWRSSHDKEIPKNLVRGMLEALHGGGDVNRSIAAVCDWVWYYYYLTQKKNDNNIFYTDLFNLELGTVPYLIRRMISERERELKSDCRWYGAIWNSDSGLWGPLVRQLEMIRDNLGGPDMLPADVQ